MIFGSVCSGIEAASVAWKPLGWRCAFVAEIDKFPSAVLAHRFPEVPNLGDFTTIGADAGPVDLLVGGTPCQSFSVAGLRGGLDDARGNLSLEFLRLARRLRPRWLVWENVPGVLSSNGGRDFGAILGGLVECGYGFAYRVLDAQHFGVPQRRRRVFVVGHLGDWRRAGAVLFEPEGMRGDSPPSREAGQRVAPSLTIGTGGGVGHRYTQAGMHDSLIAFDGNDTRGAIDVATAVNAHGGPHGRLDFESETFVAHALRAEGFDASEDGTGRGTPLVAYGIGSDALDRSGEGAGRTAAERSGLNIVEDCQPSLRARPNNSVATHSAVRRLTPRECERLQGFPDDYTLIPWRGGLAPDGPRYRALGNSFAVPVVRWIGERIDLCERVTDARAAA